MHDTPELFRKFADITTHRELAAFANQFGLLGVNHFLNRSRSECNISLSVFGEPLRDWLKCIMDVRHADAVRVAVLREDRSTLGELFAFGRISRKSEDGTVLNEWMTRKSAVLLGDEDVSPAVQTRRIEGDVVFGPAADVCEVARHHLVSEINKRLLDVPVAVIREHDSGQWVVTPYPDSLISAMWLQLASAYTGGKEYRRCRLCASPFEVSNDPGGKTKRRQFCTDACKTNDYRKRKRRAAELKAGKQSASQIFKTLASENLETDLTTIRKWVSGK